MEAARLSFQSLNLVANHQLYLYHRFEELLKSVLGDGDSPLVLGQNTWRKRKAQSLGESKVQVSVAVCFCVVEEAWPSGQGAGFKSFRIEERFRLVFGVLSFQLGFRVFRFTPVRKSQEVRIWSKRL